MSSRDFTSTPVRTTDGKPSAGGVPFEESLDRAAIHSRQERRVNELVTRIWGRNAFYTRKLEQAGIRIDGLRLPDDLSLLPMTTKRELVEDQDANPPWGTALTEPINRYTRYCQTSSTVGRPLRW